jgi:hypothetical protein
MSLFPFSFFWERRFPGIFHITDGTMETGVLRGLGLGAVESA